MPQVGGLLGNALRRLASSAGGNAGVAGGNGRGPHPPTRCRKRDCQRQTCYWYKNGREDGYEDGEDDGFRRGYAAGRAAAGK